jgi:phage tail sheath gpL-like
VHASVSSGVVTTHAKNKGAVGNEFPIVLNYRDGEALPEGIDIAVVQPTGGTTNPDLTALITALGDRWFQIIVNPYTDSGSLDDLEAEMTSRADPMRAIQGHLIAAKNASLVNVAALTASRNSEFSTIFHTDDSPTPPEEVAANAAAEIAKSAELDPAVPFQTLPLVHVLAPKETDRSDNAERDQLLHNGCATLKVSAGDRVRIERAVTTYQKNAADAPDTAYLDLNTPLTLMLLRYTYVTQIALAFPRHKIADDDFEPAPGQNVVTPKTFRAEVISWFLKMQAKGLVEGIDQFKAELVVERDADDPERMNALLPTDLVNQFIVGAAKIGFRL